MVLCDTNVIIEFFKGNLQVVQQLQKIGQPAIAISAITQAELYFGALDKKELRRIQKSLESIQTYPITTGISDQFLRLMMTYCLSHHLSIPDALIAATAIEHQVPLYTLNLKDFRFIAGLQIFAPL
jgi:tRNA(fMet)-specific endonuclease VapC